jgi:hypothetical protein
MPEQPLSLLSADLEGQVLVQLYSKLATTLSAAQTVGSRGGALLSLMIPGLYINPNLDPKDPRTAYYVSNALDATLRCSWLVTYGAGTVSNVYKTILDGKQTPLVQLTPAQREDLNLAREYLYQATGEPSAAYSEYLAAQLAYLTALDAYEQALATERNGGRKVPPRIEKALRKAERTWRDDGHQAEVDEALATVAEYEAFEPLVYWARLAAQFREWTRSVDIASEYQYVASNPPFHEWFKDFGWSELRFDETDFENQPRSGAIGVGDACVCACCGAGTEHGLVSDPEAIDIAPTSILVTCELRRVEIVRPWMNALVFRSRAWRWSPASVGYGTVISSGGDLAGSLVPTGALPVLPTTAILVRQLEIDWTDDGSLARRLTQCQEAGLEVRLGPFRLTHAAVEGGHISMPHPQLAGYLSELLPRCPNPDPVLKWPDEDVNPNEFPRAPTAASHDPLTSCSS